MQTHSGLKFIAIIVHSCAHQHCLMFVGVCVCITSASQVSVEAPGGRFKWLRARNCHVSVCLSVCLCCAVTTTEQDSSPTGGAFMPLPLLQFSYDFPREALLNVGIFYCLHCRMCIIYQCAAFPSIHLR